MGPARESPGQGRALGLWQAHDAAGMRAILASLPLHAWMSVQTTIKPAG